MKAATGELLMQRIEALAELSESPDCLTRRFATKEHRAANDLVASWMRASGMQVHEDAIGNVMGRYAGQDESAPAIVIGSHLDTVINAGKFDGMLGVLTGLACVDHLAASDMRLHNPIDIVGFADEEGVRYQSTFLGSRAYAGAFDQSVLSITDKDGISMSDALRSFGKSPEDIPGCAHTHESLAAYLEVHIEQGPVLEQREVGVGVVTGIAGASRLLATVIGMAGHAGTVPMSMRQDALAGAAEIVLAVEQLCQSDGPLVGTVGQLDVAPGAGNVIPGKVTFSLDIRAADDTLRQQTVAAIDEAAHDICQRRGLRWQQQLVHQAGSMQCDAPLVSMLSDSVAAEGLPVVQLASGAGHDAMVMADITPTAMLFVRCEEGISHNPRESVTTEDALLGARVLLHALCRLGKV